MARMSRTVPLTPSGSASSEMAAPARSSANAYARHVKCILWHVLWWTVRRARTGHTIFLAAAGMQEHIITASAGISRFILAQ